jgi:cysteine desulfurase
MLARTGIYLDSNAGAPLKEAAREALISVLREPGVLISNPSSIHSQGRKAKKALAEAKESIARSLGNKIDPEQFVMTSSGTEANQLAIRSVFEPLLAQGKKPHWITTPIEHDSIRQLIPWLEARGGTVSYLFLDKNGVPQIDPIRDLFTENTALVTAVWVNSETGVILDVASLAQFCRSRSVPLHLDAVQAWGKIPFDLNELDAQFVSFSGHKIGGLSGCGFLWVARGHPIHPVVLGKQEKGRRGGSENVLGIVAMGAAAGTLNPQKWAARVAPLRDRLQDVICNRILGTQVNGGQAPRVANTLNLNFEGVEGDSLVMALDLAGYSVSSGSACSSGAMEPSHVLVAMGRTKSQAVAAIRVSLADELSWDVLEGFIAALEKTVGKVRSVNRRE